VPVVRIDSVTNAVPLAQALMAAGLPIVEVTFRTEAAAGAIESIRDADLGVTIGAGTVRTRDQVDAAIDAGAEFLVAPGFAPSVVEYADSRGVPFIPGVATPSEMEQAAEHGLRVLKFFPAATVGGPSLLRAVAAVYPELSFVPTGGVNEVNLRSYLDIETVIACGGSWMAKPEWVEAGAWDRITETTRSALEVASGAG
jgi:2-dehydro-3-deoxyphosphogluconate aldolase/(4S)-4-hydroxy-2-oxoglutarate aldolase